MKNIQSCKPSPASGNTKNMFFFLTSFMVDTLLAFTMPADLFFIVHFSSPIYTNTSCSLISLFATSYIIPCFLLFCFCEYLLFRYDFNIRRYMFLYHFFHQSFCIRASRYMNLDRISTKSKIAAIYTFKHSR